MKISRAQLHQIIKEEVAFLVEAPNMGPFGTEASGPMGHRRGGPPGTTLPPADPEKTLPPPAPEERGSPRTLDPRAHAGQIGRISAKNLTDAAMDAILINYANATDIQVEERLGHGEFGVVYKVHPSDAPNWPQAVKITFAKEELKSYEQIMKQRAKMKAKKVDFTILPAVYDIEEMETPPLLPVDRGSQQHELQLARPGEGSNFKIYFIRMELLQPLDDNIKVDLFGLKTDPGISEETRKRFVSNYLSAKNIYSSMKEIMVKAGGRSAWKELGAVLSTSPLTEAASPASAESAQTAQAWEEYEELRKRERATISARGHAARELGISDKELAFVPVFEEIDKNVVQLRPRSFGDKWWRDLHSKSHTPASRREALSDEFTRVYGEVVNIVEDAFQMYTEDARALQLVVRIMDFPSHYDQSVPMLRSQMKANIKIPKHDPHQMARALDQRISLGTAPVSFQSREAKNAYKRLKSLEKWDARYADVHSQNLMQRANGDLVVADVGLFQFRSGKKGPWIQHGREMVERLRRLAGVI